MAPPGRKPVPKTVPKSPATPQAVSPYDFRTRDKTQPNGSKETPQGKKPVTDNTQGEMSPGSPAPDLRAEIKIILEGFQGDILKALLSKRKRLLKDIDAFIKTIKQNIEQVRKKDKEQRQKMFREYCKQFQASCQVLEADAKKKKAKLKKLTDVLHEHRKLFCQTRLLQTRKLKTFVELYYSFLKGMKELDKAHDRFLNDEDSAIRQGMAALENRILEEASQYELGVLETLLRSQLF